MIPVESRLEILRLITNPNPYQSYTIPELPALPGSSESSLKINQSFHVLMNGFYDLLYYGKSPWLFDKNFPIARCKCLAVCHASPSSFIVLTKSTPKWGQMKTNCMLCFPVLCWRTSLKLCVRFVNKTIGCQNYQTKFDIMGLYYFYALNCMALSHTHI